MKKCSECGVERQDEDFVSDKGTTTKQCVICRNRKKRYNKNNKKKLKEYYENNKDKMLSDCKKRYDKNKEKILLRLRENYKIDREKMCEKSRKYSKENPEKVKEAKKKWQSENLDKHLISSRKWQKASAKYTSFAEKLTPMEDPISGENGLLLVRCARCGKHFVPTNAQAYNRIRALDEAGGTENRIYCSYECKQSCTVFAKKGSASVLIKRQIRDQVWADKVKERAGYACERCGSKIGLVAHHEIPVKLSRECTLEQDNGICLCKKCHKDAHSEKGCTFSDLRKI